MIREKEEHGAEPKEHRKPGRQKKEGEREFIRAYIYRTHDLRFKKSRG